MRVRGATLGQPRSNAVNPSRRNTHVVVKHGQEVGEHGGERVPDVCKVLGTRGGGVIRWRLQYVHAIMGR